MTPEPTNGFYKTEGAEAFMNKYGYADKKGREDRINFGGIHKSGYTNSLTGLKLELIGFDSEKKKITDTSGRIALVDSCGNEAAAWDFGSLLLHWNRKHNQACYVPSICDKTIPRHYKYGDKVILGIGTDFQMFLGEMATGNVYYDPGIKMENIKVRPVIKKRNQFRIKSRHVSNLYNHSEIVNLSQDCIQ